MVWYKAKDFSVLAGQTRTLKCTAYHPPDESFMHDLFSLFPEALTKYQRAAYYICVCSHDLKLTKVRAFL